MNLPLRRPICHQPLTLEAHDAHCTAGHHFDRARQGYFNLVKNYKTTSGDDAAMVQAREHFLEKGYYRCLVDALHAVLKPLQPEVICDLGCSSGYYTRTVQDIFKDTSIIGMDLSKAAIRHGSTADKRIQWLIASIADIPVLDQQADLVLNLFSPLYIHEIIRILKPSGCCVLVQVGPHHLLQLKELLYPEVYLNPQAAKDYPGLTTHQQISVSDMITLAHDDIMPLLAMTPYVHRSKPSAIEALNNHDQLTTTLEFTLTVLQKN